jgi:hypothetical protein
MQNQDLRIYWILRIYIRKKILYQAPHPILPPPVGKGSFSLPQGVLYLHHRQAVAFDFPLHSREGVRGWGLIKYLLPYYTFRL